MELNTAISIIGGNKLKLILWIDKNTILFRLIIRDVCLEIVWIVFTDCLVIDWLMLEIKKI